MGKKRKNARGPQLDVTGWMVTFGDLLMLLLTFFVMLLTMSSMDQKALTAIFSIFSGAIGPMEFAEGQKIKTTASIVKKGPGGTMKFPDLEKVRAWRERLGKLIEEGKETSADFGSSLEEILGIDADSDLAGLKEALSISQDERGIIITLKELILFDRGGTELKPEALPLLDLIAELIEPLSNLVLIMGHADDMPAERGGRRSNWDLSLYRALNVHRYFVEDKGLPCTRFGVGGYGDLRPLVPNITAEGREENRRVEIIVKKT